ncbi:hypothetical protein NIES4075_35350 [Tolypothrix sp. NIES-4075]|nr:hypothetical protein NIES4075_35350 [Tolypothrix sp. NIES-4075]
MRTEVLTTKLSKQFRDYLSKNHYKSHKYLIFDDLETIANFQKNE